MSDIIDEPKFQFFNCLLLSPQPLSQRDWNSSRSERGAYPPNCKQPLGRVCNLNPPPLRSGGGSGRGCEKPRSDRSNLPPTKKRCISTALHHANYQAYFLRRIFAASTMLASAALVSGQARVFRPQSGFTHRRSFGICFSAFSIKSTMLSTLGTFGEWMS